MLKFYFFNVGHGDSIAINFPDNTWGIIDCNLKTHKEEPSVLKFLKKKEVTELRFLCLTHPHEDHFNGFDQIIAYYKEKTGQFWTYGPPLKSIKEKSKYSSFQKFLKDLMVINKRKRNFVSQINKGFCHPDIGGVKIEVLNPDTQFVNEFSHKTLFNENLDINELSIVFKFTYGDTTILLGADATEKIWNVIIDEEENIKSNILKVSHHGSKESTTKRVLDKITIKDETYSIISTDGKKHGLPHQEVINLLNKRNLKIYRTDQIGENLINISDLTPLEQRTSKELLAEGVEMASNPISKLKSYDGFYEVIVNEYRKIEIQSFSTI